ncbi:MAG: twin-arginine translocase subunit TatC [Alphaproteobacteria bacterium]|nr:twin-arginine translocase subunit TatC [Alphaproteobacteria bacterium]
MSKKPVDPLRLPLLAHALELRRRLIVVLLAILAGFVVCYIFAPEIYRFLVRPLAEADAGHERRMIYTGLTEAFVTYIRLALWGGTILAFPVIAGQIWGFVAPGLYKKERLSFLVFLLAVPILFLIGAAMAYYLVFPVAWSFFLSFETKALTQDTLALVLEARVSEYLSLAMTFIFAFGLAFQLPVLVLFLVKAKFVTARQLSAFRRYAIVLFFAVAAVITPPDVFSQIALAVPLMGLYELAVLGAKWIEKNRGHKPPDSLESS